MKFSIPLFFFFFLFKTSSSCLEPSPWMTAQIEQDFSAFESTGISQQELNAFENSSTPDDGMVRIKIISGSVIVDIDTVSPQFLKRTQWIKNALEKLVSKYPVPDSDFIVCMHDSWNQKIPHHCPIFVFAKNKNAEKQVLIPDFEALSGYIYGQNFLMKAKKSYPWKIKKQQCFWRGSTTGGIFDNENWRDFARSKIVLMSFDFPKLIDARFTHLVQGAELIPDMEALLSPLVQPFDSLRYKYLVDIDGNTCAFSRLYWAMLSNSVVLKQVTDNVQWYYGAIRPYEHYIPVMEDLSDLIVQIQWAWKQDDTCREIAEKATEFVLEELNDERIYLYLYEVILKYAELKNTTEF